MSSDTQSRHDEVYLYYRVCVNLDWYFQNGSVTTIIELAFTSDMINSFYVTRGRSHYNTGKLVPESEITKTSDNITYSDRTFARARMLYSFYGSVQDFLHTEYVSCSKEDLQYIESIKLLSML